MIITSDLQIHSRFSRATSKKLTLPNILWWAQRKGIDLVATGDWNHPLWMREIKNHLEETGNGFLRLRRDTLRPDNGFEESDLKTQKKLPRFLLATEVSCIYSQGGKGRRIHILLWVPSIASAEKINKEMTKRGCNLLSDGRPIIGLTAINVAELVLTIEPRALVIPAHVWTPWFSLFGSMSGFDSIDDAFGPFAKHIYGVETGLSSSPDMNWRIKELDNRTILSFSDAHSGRKLGREVTAFSFEGLKREDFTYKMLYSAIQNNKKTEGNACVAHTIEFYPEEGKYHYTGHRTCKIRQAPENTKKKGMICEVCGKSLTQGVMQRVEQLAGRSEESLKLVTQKRPLFGRGPKITVTQSKAFPQRPPFVMLVPLIEIISEAIEKGEQTQAAEGMYARLLQSFENEFHVLLSAEIEDIKKVAGDRVAEAIDKVRNRDIVIDPGYDGVFGVVKIWKDDEAKPLIDSSKEQLAIF